MSRILALLLAAAVLAGPAAAAGTPSEAYLAYHATLKGSFSDSAIWPYYTTAAREEFLRKFPPELRGRAFYMMKATAPLAVKVTREEIESGQATLTLRPTAGDDRLIGTATLRREEGEWKLEKVLWRQE